MSTINDDIIVREATERLKRLLDEDAVAVREAEIRGLEIAKAKAVIELFSKPVKIDFSVTSSVNKEFTVPVITAKEQPTVFDFSNEKTWIDRIKAFLKFKNKVSTISDMFNAFKGFEKKSDDQILGAITNTVSTMSKRGLLKVYKPPIKMKGYFYGNPLWFEGEILKDEHLPNLREKTLW